jgi:hypothetical protein
LSPPDDESRLHWVSAKPIPNAVRQARESKTTRLAVRTAASGSAWFPCTAEDTYIG